VCLGHVALFIKHADDRTVRARARAVLRVRDRVSDCVGSCIPDRAESQPIADQVKAVSVLAGTDFVNVAAVGSPKAVLPFSLGYHIASRRCKARTKSVSKLITPSISSGWVDSCGADDDGVLSLPGLSTRHPSIHETRVIRLVDSSFRAPHLPDAAGTRLCSGGRRFYDLFGTMRLAT
jgi:hypothetical protein